MDTLKEVKTIKYKLETLTCPSCIVKIESMLNKQSGVEKAKVLFNSSNVKVEYDEKRINAEKMKEMIERLGYPILS